MMMKPPADGICTLMGCNDQEGSSQEGDYPCCLTSVAIVLIMAPILFPVAVKLGIDPVHFGIMMVVNMEIELCTPPVGLNLYVGSAKSRLGLTAMSVAVVPWLITALVFLALITYVPAITIALPNLLGL